MPIFSLKCFRTDTQVARNRVRGFGLLKPHTVPARIVSPLSVAFSTLSAFQVESVEQPWLVPGIERHPLKKIEPDEATLLRLLRRWQEEATKAGHPITPITLAFEAGRDGSGWPAGYVPTASKPM